MVIGCCYQVSVNAFETMGSQHRHASQLRVAETNVLEFVWRGRDRLDAHRVGSSVKDLEYSCLRIGQGVEANFGEGGQVFVVLRDDKSHDTFLTHVVIELEVDKEWPFHIRLFKVKIADLCTVSCQLFDKIGAHHTTRVELINERFNFFTEFFLCVWAEIKSSSFQGVQSDHHSERVAKRLPLIEVKKHIFINSLSADPVRAPS